MATTMLPGRVTRLSQFVGGLTGACGPCALAVGNAWSYQTSYGVLDAFNLMRSNKLCDAHGDSTIANLYKAAALLKLGLPAYREYSDAPWPDFATFFQAHAGRRYLLAELANGQALVDALTGDGENARGLQYHFIGIVGRHTGGWSPALQRELPAGYVIVDGDSLSSGPYTFISDQVMASARPCAAFVINPGATTRLNSPFTRNSDGTATDPRTNAHLGTGFAAYVFDHNIQAKCVIGETGYAPGCVYAAFDSGLVLTYTAQEGVQDNRAYEALGALQGHINQPAPVDAAAEQAKAALTSLKSALAVL